MGKRTERPGELSICVDIESMREDTSFSDASWQAKVNEYKGSGTAGVGFVSTQLLVSSLGLLFMLLLLMLLLLHSYALRAKGSWDG